MVRDFSLKQRRHLPDGAKLRRVILARTRVPPARLLDVYLARRVRVVEKFAG